MDNVRIQIRRTRGFADILKEVYASGVAGGADQSVLAALLERNTGKANGKNRRGDGNGDGGEDEDEVMTLEKARFMQKAADFLHAHSAQLKDHPELTALMKQAASRDRKKRNSHNATAGAGAAGAGAAAPPMGVLVNGGNVAKGAAAAEARAAAEADAVTAANAAADMDAVLAGAVGADGADLSKQEVLAEVAADVEGLRSQFDAQDLANKGDGTADEWVDYDPATKYLQFSAEGLPLGLVLDRWTGVVSGTSRASTTASHTILIVAREVTSGGFVEGEYVVNEGPLTLEITDCADPGQEGVVDSAAPSCGGENGKCIDVTKYDNDFQCQCSNGYTGKTCELEASPASDSKSDKVALGVTIGVIILLLLLGSTVIGVWRYQARIERMRPIDFMNYWSDFKSRNVLQVDVERKTPKEIPRKLVTIGPTIGAGAFGEVSQGNLNEQNSKGLIGITVAVKRAKLDMEAGEFEQQRAFIDLIQEAALMAQFDHPNILGLIGVCTKGVTGGEPLLLIVQYCEKGNLVDFLNPAKRSQKEVPIHLRLRICKEVAMGMHYLASKCFIHRDLAARNVLVNAEFVCKVSDFGLSRDIGSDDDEHGKRYYRTTGEGALPVRWTAIEALEESRFTTASDVWSFGILVVEVFQDCSTPYAIQEKKGFIFRVGIFAAGSL